MFNRKSSHMSKFGEYTWATSSGLSSLLIAALEKSVPEKYEDLTTFQSHALKSVSYILKKKLSFFHPKTVSSLLYN